MDKLYIILTSCSTEKNWHLTKLLSVHLSTLILHAPGFKNFGVFWWQQQMQKSKALNPEQKRFIQSNVHSKIKVLLSQKKKERIGCLTF